MASSSVLQTLPSFLKLKTPIFCTLCFFAGGPDACDVSAVGEEFDVDAVMIEAGTGLVATGESAEESIAVKLKS